MKILENNADLLVIAISPLGTEPKLVEGVFGEFHTVLVRILKVFL
jgi:hypothetical protein